MAAFLPSNMSANNIRKYLNTVRQNIPTRAEAQEAIKSLNINKYTRRVGAFKKSLNWLGNANANALRNSFKNGSYNNLKPYLSDATKIKINLGKALESTSNFPTKSVERLTRSRAPVFRKRVGTRVGGRKTRKARASLK